MYAFASIHLINQFFLYEHTRVAALSSQHILKSSGTSKIPLCHLSSFRLLYPQRLVLNLFVTLLDELTPFIDFCFCRALKTRCDLGFFNRFLHSDLFPALATSSQVLEYTWNEIIFLGGKTITKAKNSCKYYGTVDHQLKLLKKG